jgi:TolB-like protein
MRNNKNRQKMIAKLLSGGGWLVVVIGIIAMAGCSQVQKGRAVSVASPDFFGIGENLARQLIANRHSGFGLDEKLIFSTMVNLDDLYQTSKFGRALSESLATRLFRHGYGVVELRKISGLLIKNNSGELVLSRETGRLAKEYEANAIVAGTYSMTPKSIIINVKVLDAVSQDVLSVAGLEIARSLTINYLLADGGPVIDSLSGDEHF